MKKLVTTMLVGIASITQVAAQEQGTAIRFGNLDHLLWSIVKTIQVYTIPLMAIGIALLGLKLLTSGDDTSAKESAKNWMVKILIGGTLIFGAASLAQVLQTAIGG